MQSRKSYIETMYPLAEKATAGSGIFPLTAIVLDIIETSSKASDGNYYAGTSKNAVNAKNHFGIKASPGWKGAVYVNPDVKTESNTFRKYNSIFESYLDFVNFLQVNPRYARAGVFEATNAREQLKRIAEAGYGGPKKTEYFNLASSILKSAQNIVKTASAEVKKNPLLFFVGAAALFLIAQKSE